MPPRRRSYAKRRAPARRYARPSVRRRRSTGRRVSRPVRSKSSCACPSELTPGIKFALAQLDPFDPTALGAKIPDSNTQPSISTSDVEQNSLLTGAVATNLHAMAFRPNYTLGVVTATPGAPIVWPAAYAGGANRAKRAAYSGAIELTRPVAHAIRITSPVAPTTASGFVHIAISTETLHLASTWQYPTTIEQISSCQFYKRVTLASLTQSPLTIINKWIDDTAFRYSSPTSSISSAGNEAFQTDYGWAAIVIITEGVPVSTVVLSAEHVLISEGIPNKDSPLIGTAAASANPTVISAVSDMQAQQDSFHTEEQQNDFMQRGAAALARGARAQGMEAFNSIGIPILESVGRGAVSMALVGVNQLGIGGVNNNPNRISN